ncbi:MAG: DUF5106 domain-containing protein [Bacteroidales bacterium]|nr:DUF5106 domain-containing protein [Bacteroidales bacterium]
MRSPAAYVTGLLMLILTSCASGGGVCNYWDDVDIVVTESNYSAAEERFARFAELLVQAPGDEAEKALGVLFDRIKEDEVSYYVYADWIESAFHNYLSPCRNPIIFGKAAELFERDGIIEQERIQKLRALAAQDMLNRPGEHCTVPDGAEAAGSALYLVLNLDCRTCLQSLEALSKSHPEAEHIALCFGYSPLPGLSGWKYLKPDGMGDIFDLEAAPFWFLTADDGSVSIPYCAEFQEPVFASPEKI